MADAKSTIDDKTAEFISRQKMFFVATAPLAQDGRVNLSPRGLDSLRVLNSGQVAWADFVGSGIETIAHLRENGRIVVMFCAFEGAPGIVRLHGTGRAIEAADAEFEEWIGHFPERNGVRAVIVVDCERVSRTCGFGVPLMSFEGDREELPRWCEKKGDDGLIDYQRRKNAVSLDGLPGIDVSRFPD